VIVNKPRILAQHAVTASARVARHALSPGQIGVVAVLALSGVAAFGLSLDTTLDTTATATVVRALALPQASRAEQGAAIFWREERVERGDTIGSLLARAAVDDAAALAYLSTNPAARPLYRLRPGRPVRIATDDHGRMLALRFLAGDGDVLEITRRGNAFAATSAPPIPDVRLTLRAGQIRSSLFVAADEIGLPDAVTLALADIFAGDVDFYHDLRAGDRFSVLFETRYVDGEPASVGRVLAAEFVNRGVTFRAFLWQAPDGSESYYAENGWSTRKAFLRSPMELSRITSGFTQARFHPILQTWRAHRGIDFAAPTGTPIRATGDGVIALAGQQEGYGNVLAIRHSGTYSTLYGHLSGFAARIRTGVRVRQGETIGYVGQTGWATGPHLHYEFRIAGEARDPLSLALPTALPVAAEDRARFDAAVASRSRELAVAQAAPDARIAAAR
jgi:murein DD-endopeptidase MepM/ murein hydrolase activator NlpD